MKIMVLAMVLFFSSVVSTFAQSPQGSLSLVTSPLPINLVTTPGSTTSAQLKIKNGGQQTELLQIGMMKFVAFGDEGKPRLIDREAGDDYFDWVTFSEKEFSLDPGEWKTIIMTINVPDSASFGYYYAVTFSRKNPDVLLGPRATKVVGATSCLVLLEVRVPNAVREIEVLEFSSPQKIYEFLPTKFLIKLKNKGNVHVVPRGNIFISRGSQKEVAILTINEFRGNVLPDSNRIYESEWKDGFPVYELETKDGTTAIDDKGKEVKKLKWDFSQVTKLRWGKYTANMLMVYDDGQRDIPIEAKMSFWVMPWRLIGGGLVVFLLVLTGLWSTIIRPIKKIFEKRKNE
jgi:hypothetical protein